MGSAKPALEHWIVRSRGDLALFRDDVDRDAFVDLLAARLPRAGLSCAAWALLTHHVELLVVLPAEAPPDHSGPVIQGFVVDYARDFNRRHGRSGYVFAEPTEEEDALRVFDVVADGAPLITPCDVFLLAGTPASKNTLLVGTMRALRERHDLTVTDGRLDVEFTITTGVDSILSAISLETKAPAPTAG